MPAKFLLDLVAWRSKVILVRDVCWSVRSEADSSGMEEEESTDNVESTLQEFGGERLKR